MESAGPHPTTSSNDWHLRRLWQHAKNRGFNIRLDEGLITLVPGSKWNATPVRTFPWTDQGIRDASKGVDHPAAMNDKPNAPVPVQNALAQNNVVRGAKRGARYIFGWIIGFVVTGTAISGVVGWWNNNHYSSTFNNSFVTNCEAQGASASYCGCSLNEVHQLYTPQQAEQQLTSSSSTAVQAIASSCATYR